MAARDLAPRPAVQPRGGTFWRAGDRATVRLTGAETAGQLAVVEFLVVPGGGPPPHVHLREDETFILLEGELALYLGDERIVARAGDLVHVPTGAPHRFRNETPACARCLVLIAPAGHENFFAEAGVPCAAYDLDPPPVDDALIARLRTVGERRHVRFA